MRALPYSAAAPATVVGKVYQKPLDNIWEGGVTIRSRKPGDLPSRRSHDRRSLHKVAGGATGES